jgi:DUF2934 family protein
MPTKVRREDIERRAYELYEQRGREEGHDWDDWLQAEREMLGAETEGENEGQIFTNCVSRVAVTTTGLRPYESRSPFHRSPERPSSRSGRRRSLARVAAPRGPLW